MIGIIAL